MAMPDASRLADVYGAAAPAARARLEELAARHVARFGGATDLSFYSSPGRTEIIGNHTDHNGGTILAASITMDTIAAAAPTGSSVVTIVSEGYAEPIVVDVDALDEAPRGSGSTALVAGMLVAARAAGYRVGGFDATVSTQVIPAAGVSSSASFEMLVAAIVNDLFNAGAIPVDARARMGQYAENVFWGKASGLMDQMACAVGGTIALDFSAGVRYERVDFSYDALGMELVIVNTGPGHADLSDAYSAVPAEMRAVAAALGVENLCETCEGELVERLPEVRAAVGNDRAILRALHYFEECRRVEAAVRAIAAGEPARVLDLIDASGRSSWTLLQNAYVASNPTEQSVPVALAMTRLFLDRLGAGAARLHGGGFAGVIMCAVPRDATDAYIDFMAPVFGCENIYRTGIRQAGAVAL